MLNVDEHSHEFKVVALSPGGPAQRSGLVRVGDVILKIEGQPLRGLTPQQVVDLITGPRDTQVELLIQSPIVYDVHTAHFQELPFTGVKPESWQPYAVDPTHAGRDACRQPAGRSAGIRTDARSLC